MLSRLTRVSLSFAIVLSAYWLYAAIAVPLIEPGEGGKGGGGGGVDVVDNPPATDRQREMLAHWFRPDDWELGTPKVLYTPQGILLVDNYRVLEEQSRVELWPCTMIFLPDETSGPPEERYRRAVIMRSSPDRGKAVLHFDGPIDIAHGKIGKMIGGQILGNVTIYSQQKSLGPEDDLLVHARDIELRDNRVTSSNVVDLRWGYNTARGQRLKMELSTDDKSRGLKGLLAVELQQQVELHLEGMAEGFMPGSGASPAAPTAPVAAGPTRQPSPVEVRSRGAFRFDFVEYVATFQDQVNVERLGANGKTEQLACELLSIYFKKPKKEDQPPVVETPGPKRISALTAGVPRFEPERVVAFGQPAQGRVESSEVSIRAGQIEYEVASGIINLRDGQEVVLQQGGREIHCRELFAEPDETKRLGRFLAKGDGWVKGSMPDDKQQSFSASWTRRLHFRPHEKQHVLSLEGNAHVSVIQAKPNAQPDNFTVDADEIHLWLNAKRVPGTSPGADDRIELEPDRLMSVGKVTIESPQLTGVVSQLQAWFEPAGQATPGWQQFNRIEPWRGGRWQVTSSNETLTGEDAHLVPLTPCGREWRALASRVRGFGAGEAPLPSSALRAPSPTRGEGFVPRGILAQLVAPPPGYQPRQIAPQIPATPQPQLFAPPLNERQPQFVAQQPSVGPAAAAPQQGEVLSPLANGLGNKRIHVEGELLRIRAKHTQKQLELSEIIIEHDVRVRETATDRPGEQPLTITGKKLHVVQQSANESVVTVSGQPAHVEGRGMTLDSAAINLNRLTSSIWTDGSGQMTLLVERDPEGKQLAKAQRLEVTWQEKLEFSGRVARFRGGVIARQAQQLVRTQLLEVTLTEPINFNGGQPAGKIDVEQISCREGVFFENPSFDLNRLVSLDRMQTAELNLHRPTGQLTALGPGWVKTVRLDTGKARLPGANNNPAADVPPPGGAAASLVFVGVEFQGQLSGNMARRELVFESAVRTIYGPVQHWEGSLNPDRPAEWTQDGLLMTSDRLAIVQLPGATPEQRTYEMEATGNTVVEGALYTARAARITYAQAKELLVIEGNGRSDAELMHQPRPGAASSKVNARKIMFWPNANRVEVDDARMLDLNGLK